MRQLILPAWVVALALSAVLALACSGPEPETVPDGIPTPTPSPTPTAVVPADPSPSPEPTPSPTRTPSPQAPTATPSPRAEDTATPQRPSATAVPTESAPAEPTAEPTVEVTVSPAPSPSPTAGPSPVRGGALRLTTRSDIAHQDVHFDASPALSTWGPGIAYSRLLRFRTGPDVALPSLEVVCDLCSSWRAIDPVTFEFTLREGVAFHDDALVGGRHLSAADLVYSFDRQRTGPNAALLGSIDSISAPDGLTLRMGLVEPDADFVIGLADARSKIVAREAVDLAGDLRAGPTVGTGPWRLTSTGRQGLHLFEAFPGDDLPYADALQVHLIDDILTRDAAFAVGHIDIMEVTPMEWEALRDRVDDAVSLVTPGTGSGVEIGLSPLRAPFDDPDVRRAALAAMDPDRALSVVWLGAGRLTFGFPLIGPDWGLDEADLAGRVADPDRARELLSGTRPAHLTIRVGRYGEEYIRHAQIVAAELRSVGFEVEVEDVTRLAYAEAWRAGDYQMLLGPVPPVTAPNAYLLSVVHSAGPYNIGGPPDAELDALIERQAGEYDPQVRRLIHRDIQLRMLDSATRYMPVAHASVWAAQPWVRNLGINVAGLEYAHWASVWLEK